MKSVKVIDIFLSSPSDLLSERQKVKTYIEQKIHIDGYKLNVILWEEKLPSMPTTNIQGEITERLLNPSDMLIGLFKRKFGTKTENSSSGTVEEIEEFIAQSKPVMLYFFNYTIDRSAVSSDDLKELAKICEFQENYRNKGVYRTINSIEQICEYLDQDVRFHIEELSKNINVSKGYSYFPSLGVTQQHLPTESKQEGHGWYSYSIGTAINHYLKQKGIEYIYKFDLTFHENLLLAQGTSEKFMNSTLHDIFNSARTFAFNEKYGNYDYSFDLRSKFTKWYEPLKQLIRRYYPNNFRSLSFVDIGGNCGTEMKELLGSSSNSVTIVDLSNEALTKGATLYPKYKFVQANMEEPYCIGESFDICLCLRAIQSTGVLRNDAIIQMSKIVKPEGLIVISIPNGYIGENNEIIRGLYDYRTQSFSTKRPLGLVAKIERKLQDYGFKSTGVLTLDSEIIVWGKKSVITSKSS